MRSILRMASLPVLLLSVSVAVAADPPSAASKAETAKDFVYKKTGDVQLKLHVHYPPDWKQENRRPAIVFFFGGGWTGGRVSQFEPQAAYLAGRGMVAVRADYRVKNRHGVTPDACVEDAKSAVRWLRQLAGELGIDPERIVAAGGSAGGHIAACTALTEGLEAKDEDADVSSRPSALLLFNPVLQFSGAPALERRLPASGRQELARQLSPTLHVKKETVPTLILFGTGDRLLRQGEAFMAAAKQAGCRAELYTAPDKGHGFFNRSPWQQRTLRRADEFLASLGYLEGEPTIVVPEDKASATDSPLPP